MLTRPAAPDWARETRRDATTDLGDRSKGLKAPPAKETFRESATADRGESSSGLGGAREARRDFFGERERCKELATLRRRQMRESSSSLPSASRTRLSSSQGGAQREERLRRDRSGERSMELTDSCSKARLERPENGVNSSQSSAPARAVRRPGKRGPEEA
mmetsp:Transcript_74543/g.131843  ORF Transcript_74543/g.131843 Transcript_74543/m.131843 type:complete len:161 (-) Transcript_74543:1264-1746(-)